MPESDNPQKLWEQRIDKAKKVQKEWKEYFKVEKAREYFKGKQNPGYPDNEWITINKIYSHLMAQLPNLYSIDPYFYVKVKKSYQVEPEAIAEFERKGKIRQAMLNYMKGELKLKKHARLAILDAEFAYGVIKIRHLFDEIENPRAGEQIVNEDGVTLKDEDGNPLTYPDVIPANMRFSIDRVHPDDIIFDADAGTMENKWGFIAERIRMTREQAKKDKRLDKAAVDLARVTEDKEKKTGFFSAIKTSWSEEKQSREDDVLVFWEIYDLEKKEWLMMAENGVDLVKEPGPLPKGVECHPYEFLMYVPLDDTAYPLPPVSQAIDPQKEYCLARSRILTHRKRFNRKYIAITGQVDEDEADKFVSGEDGTMVWANNGSAIQVVQDAPLDNFSYNELSLLNNDMVEVFGSPDNARGIANSDSATEASLLDKHLEIREGDKLSIVIDFVTGIASKLDQLIQANLDRDMAVRITGPQGEFWQAIKTEDYESISGEFEYSVNVGASRPRLPDIERSQWIAFLSQVVIPMPHILTAPSVMKRMAEMFHIEDEAALEELRQLGLKIMNGQMPMPGGQGSQAGVPEDNPVTKILGAALGQQGGNVNGGGSPQSASVQ